MSRRDTQQDGRLDGFAADHAGGPSDPSPQAVSTVPALIVDALTPRAKDFVRLNRSHSVVMAEWLDKDRKSPTGPPETWVKMRYRFDSGQQITLHEDDLASLSAANIKPVWWADRNEKARA